MFFKTLTAYRLSGKLPDAAAIAAKLQTKPAAEPNGLDWFAEGFAPPQAFSSDLVFETDGVLGLRLKRQEKILPAAAINERVSQKIDEIQAAENRRVGRSEKAGIKEQIIDELLPQALTRSRSTFAMIAKGWLLVGAPPKQAETLLTQLRQALGGLEARLPQTQMSPATLMTDWLLHRECAGGFALDNDCELHGAGGMEIAKFAKQDLTADEIVQHVKNGKTVSQLGLVWREQLAFVLTSDFTLKKIQFLDVLQQEAHEWDGDAENVAFASQLIAARTFTEILNQLSYHLGGSTEKV